MHKKILVTSYYFYPEINPRSFRVYSLVKELSKQGYEVDVVIPDYDFSYKEIEANYNINILTVKSGFFMNKYEKHKSERIKPLDSTISKSSRIPLFFKKILKKIYFCVFFGGKTVEYTFTLYNYLKNISKEYDAVISIGLPISVHFATSLYLRDKEYLKYNSVADYGDPFSFNSEVSKCFYYVFLEKRILKNFRYIAVPIDSAKEKFFEFKEKEFIKTIPQGFDFTNLEISKYKKNNIPTFGYAGIFYEEIRNPKVFLDYLSTLKTEFQFIIYTDIRNKNLMKMLTPYEGILKHKLLIKDLIPREECIYELSKLDFLINQNNLFKEQSPSKLIDYMLTMRPIFSFTQNTFSEESFFNFLNSDFIFTDKMKSENIQKLEKFKSKNVANQFLKLFNDMH